MIEQTAVQVNDLWECPEANDGYLLVCSIIFLGKNFLELMVKSCSGRWASFL